MKKVTALIASAGLGKRMALKGKKQYLLLDGKPLIAHTLSIFEAHDGIESIVLVVPEGEVEYCRKEIVNEFGYKKVHMIISGGRERQDSIRKGLECIIDSEFVLIHDGVRPFVTNNIIDRVLKGAFKFGAASAGIEVKDTVKRVSQDGWVEKTIDRKRLYLIQTPQAFRTEWIKEAHEMARSEGLSFTDDCGLLEVTGKSVKIVDGSFMNIKITTVEDLDLARAIILRKKGLK